MDLSRPLTDRRKICTQVWCGIKAESLLSKIFLSIPKNLAGKNSNSPQPIEDSRQLEARNFETAQHIDKQITEFHLQ